MFGQMTQRTWFAALLIAGLLAAAGGWGAFRVLASERTRGAPVAGAAAAAEAAVRDKDIAFFERRAAEDPISAADRAELASRYLQRSRETGDFNDVLRAEELARKSLSLRASHNSETSVTLIAALIEQHRFTEALKLARQLVADEPASDRYTAMLGEISLEVGDYDAARAAFASLSGRSRASLSIAPSFARWLEISGDPAAARRIMYRAMAIADSTPELPREPVAWFHLRVADMEMRNGRLRSAERALRGGRDILPRDHRLLAADARLAALRHDWKRAVALGDSAVAIVLDPGTLGLVGDAYLALGDSAKAEEYIRTMEVAVVQQPGEYHRAWSLFLLDHNRRVPEVLEKVRSEIESRRDIYAYDLLAWAHFKQRHYGEAQAAMQIALSQGTQDAVLHYHAGMIARGAGNSSLAMRHLERALEINPVFDPFHPSGARLTLDSIRRGR